MLSRLCKTGLGLTGLGLTGLALTGLGLTLLAVASAPAGAATLAPQIHPPAQFRIDFPRHGVMPGTPRDIAAARDLGSNETVGLGTNGNELTIRHKRRPRTH